MQSGEQVAIDPIELSPEQRSRYRWEGPEVIYTFWAKHCTCQAKGCYHRVPIFKNSVIAEKKLSTNFIPAICPSCKHAFNIELGETRMAPSAERAILANEPSFTELSQLFATHIKQYAQGNGADKRERILKLLDLVDAERGLKCPNCNNFAGQKIKAVLERHARAGSVAALKKKDFGLESRNIYMYLLINSKWLFGANGLDSQNELGGYAGASANNTKRWHERRLTDLGLHRSQRREFVSQRRTFLRMTTSIPINQRILLTEMRTQRIEKSLDCQERLS